MKTKEITITIEYEDDAEVVAKAFAQQFDYNLYSGHISNWLDDTRDLHNYPKTNEPSDIQIEAGKYLNDLYESGKDINFGISSSETE